MSRSWIMLAALPLLASGCVKHSAAWDDAWAKCQAEAQEAMETAAPADDQRSTFLQDYSNQCMEKKGFKVEETI